VLTCAVCGHGSPEWMELATRRLWQIDLQACEPFPVNLGRADRERPREEVRKDALLTGPVMVSAAECIFTQDELDRYGPKQRDAVHR
jgi:hypothetical protein